ncbi:MAG TPA: hypothetical protein VII60_03665 [Acidimicrobiales bacterium]
MTDEQNETSFDESEEIAYLRATPVETVLGNHFFVLLQLAALQLSATPANLTGAQLVIDTIAAMLQAGGSRLGEHVDLYKNALAEVQQLYVRAASAPAPTAAPAPEPEPEPEKE